MRITEVLAAIINIIGILTSIVGGERAEIINL